MDEHRIKEIWLAVDDQKEMGHTDMSITLFEGIFEEAVNEICRLRRQVSNLSDT